MARMPAPPSDLEIEDPDGGPPAGASQKRRRTLNRAQLVVVILLVVGVLAVAFPVRVQINRSEARRLQRRWTAVTALDQARSGDLTALNRAGAPGDGIQVHSTASALYDQQATDVASLRSSLDNDLIIDSGLKRLRAAMSHALTLEAADLSNAAKLWRTAPPAVAPSYLDRFPATIAAIDKADQLLAAQSGRFSLRALGPGSAPHFPVADVALASFKRFLDQPAGVTLLADTSRGLQTIDIDQSVIRPAQVPGLPAGVNNIVVGRPDFVVFQHPSGAGSQSGFYVIPADLRSSAVSIGTGGQVVAGSDPATFWRIGLDDTAAEVSSSGAVMAGPVALPTNRFVVAATATGLVLQPHLQSDLSLVPEPIEIWDPVHQALTRTITDAGLGVLAADAETVAWVSASGTIHLTDTVSGGDRTVATPGYLPQLVGAAFSPDGARLATTMRSSDGSHTVPAVVDVATGAVRIGASDEFPPVQPGSIAWTASSDRLFVPMSSATPTNQVLTYRPGDGGPHYLRLPDSNPINVFAVVPIKSG